MISQYVHSFSRSWKKIQAFSTLPLISHCLRRMHPLMPLIMEGALGFVLLSIILWTQHDDMGAWERIHILKSASIFTLCFFAMSFFGRTYLKMDVFHPWTFAIIFCTYFFSFVLFTLLWKLLTKDMEISFFPVILTYLLCFAISLGIRILKKDAREKG